MSDHDEPTEPTEPTAPVTAEVLAAGEPEASGETPPGKSSLFVGVNARRVSIALVVIALVWLGAWAYSSGSSVTGSSATNATAAPPTSAPARQRPRDHRRGITTTTLAPPPNLPRTPQAYATALIGYWVRLDRTDAYRVATKKAVNRLFTRRLFPDEHVMAQGCAAAGSYTTCAWTTVRHRVVLVVRNPSASTAVLVVGVRATHV